MVINLIISMITFKYITVFLLNCSHIYDYSWNHNIEYQPEDNEPG